MLISVLPPCCVFVVTVVFPQAWDPRPAAAIPTLGHKKGRASAIPESKINCRIQFRGGELEE